MAIRVGLGIGGNVGSASKLGVILISETSDVGLVVGDRVGVTPGMGGGQVESQVEYTLQ